MSQNPYVEKIGHELEVIFQGNNGHWELEMAEYVLREHVTPRNQKIHTLTSEVARLNANINRLGKVLERHNAGVCKAGESPIDCAIRMLSPVRDDTPKRDRP